MRSTPTESVSTRLKLLVCLAKTGVNSRETIFPCFPLLRSSDSTDSLRTEEFGLLLWLAKHGAPSLRTSSTLSINRELTLGFVHRMGALQSGHPASVYLLFRHPPGTR